MTSRELTWITFSVKRETWKLKSKTMKARFKRSTSRMSPDWTIWILSKEMSMKNLRKKTPCSIKRLLTPETNWKTSIVDSPKPNPDWDRILLSREPSTWRKREPIFSRRRRILSSRPTRWTYHFQKLEKDSKIVLSMTTLKLSKWIKRFLIWRRWLITISKISKKSTKILKRKTLNPAKSKNTKFFTKRKKRSTPLQNNSRLRKFNTRRRLLRTSNTLRNYSSICRRLWLEKISCQPLLMLEKWEMILSSNKDNWKILRPQPPDWRSTRIKFRAISRKSRTLRVEF